MGLKRRTFLQGVGGVLAALGASEAALSWMDNRSLRILDRYYQALAEPSDRKLALLVGINQYSQLPGLSGCLTDVELQRELLIYRFAFHPSDIVTLTDRQATRENIENTFLTHLSAQAKPGDVVIFHFSGYGSRVSIAESDGVTESSKLQVQNSLVPVDGVSSGKEEAVSNHLLMETLHLLLRSLSTNRITTVLDTGYASTDLVLPGNLRVRSRPSFAPESPSAAELAFQSQLREQFKYPLPTQMPGLILTAATGEQQALEATGSGFSAGVFTYALTQHLWQATPATTVQVSINQVAGTIQQLVGQEQQPSLSGNGTLATYHLPPSNIGADAVITAVEESTKTIQVWLGGLAPAVLGYATNGVFALAGETTPVLQIRSREGLMAKVRVIGAETLPIGQLLQEKIRVLPHNIGLTIALDASLERIERVDATSAFATIAPICAIITANEQPADYLFGKVASRVQVASLNTTNLQIPEGGYELFSVAHNSLPNTAGDTGEAIKVAVNRLLPKLKTLLAAKLWRLTANEGTSRLGVKASLEIVAPKPKILMARESGRSPAQLNKNIADSTDILPILPSGSQIQYRLQNYSDRPVYFMLFGLDSNGSAIALYPPSNPPSSETLPPTSEGLIPPGGEVVVPPSEAAFKWLVQGTAGWGEIQVICSQAPFTQTMAALAAALHSKRDRVSELLNPLDIAHTVLQDLHQASLPAAEISAVPDSYALDVNAWATLSFIYQVA